MSGYLDSEEAADDVEVQFCFVRDIKLFPSSGYDSKPNSTPDETNRVFLTHRIKLLRGDDFDSLPEIAFERIFPSNNVWGYRTPVSIAVSARNVPRFIVSFWLAPVDGNRDFINPRMFGPKDIAIGTNESGTSVMILKLP
jgi:hypothetical protein